MHRSTQEHLLIALLLATLVTAAFFPTLTAEICGIDDANLLSSLAATESWRLINVFLPGDDQGVYYRPLIVSSFLIDKDISGLNLVWMHSVNLLLHFINAFLVYQIARKLTTTPKWLPIASAMLFIVHPLTTESVSWLSGRTDLLATVGILGSTLALVCYRTRHQRRFLLTAIMSFLFAVMSKETACAFLPCAVLILMSGNPEQHHSGKLWRNLVLVGGVTAVVALVIVMRFTAFTTNVGTISRTFQYIANDWAYSLMILLRVFGFYLKKLIIPWPLNFALVEVDPLYDLLAIPLALVCVYILLRWRLKSGLFISGIIMFLPAFFIAFNQVSWAPYAERYLYTSIALMVFPVLDFLRSICIRPAEKIIGTVLLLTLFITYCGTSLQRSFTWQVYEKLIMDTVAKSPGHKPSRMDYGHVLALKGDYSGAIEQYRMAKTIVLSIGYDPGPDLAIAEVLVVQGENQAAGQLYEDVLTQTRGRSLSAIEAFINYLDNVYPEDIPGRTAKYKKFYQYQLQMCGEESQVPCYGAGLAALNLGQVEMARSLLIKVESETKHPKLRDKAEDALLKIPEG